jgi:hypothetical protein
VDIDGPATSIIPLCVYYLCVHTVLGYTLLYNNMRVHRDCVWVIRIRQRTLAPGGQMIFYVIFSCCYRGPRVGVSGVIGHRFERTSKTVVEKVYQLQLVNLDK